MKILTFTTLYPNNIRERHGVFVENRIKKLATTEQISVVAPVPYVPKFLARGEWRHFAGVQSTEMRHGLKVYHPRFLTIPKVGMSLAPLLLATYSLLYIRSLIKTCKTEFQLIDAHYVYPDGVAAIIIGIFFRKPVLITARGSDINTIPEFFVPRIFIKWSLRKASHVFAVSDSLREKIISLGIAPTKVSTVRNGVDSEVFYQDDFRDEKRRNLGVKSKLVLSVGNLVSLKGHDLVIDAIDAIPHASLMIIGEGVEHPNLVAQIKDRALGNRVTIVPSFKQEQLRGIYSAADLLVLASSREGLPNVLLEAMACGTRVVSTKVGGAPEVVTSINAGVLVERTVPALRNAIETELATDISRESTIECAKQFDANQSIKKWLAVAKDVVGTEEMSGK